MSTPQYYLSGGHTLTGGYPWIEGVCQASYSRREDNFRRLRCMHPDCDFVIEGYWPVEHFVEQWNAHVRFR